MKHRYLRAAFTFGITASMFLALPSFSFAGDATVQGVAETYVAIAHAGYEDSYLTAKKLQKAVHELVKNPSEETLEKARTAWLPARVPYQQTEVYRFGNAIVDDWEGKVNSWPLDEGLIDYVDTSFYGEESDANPFYNANVIANPELIIGGKKIDASRITPALIKDELHEVDDVEANVASGYHAIEFLLWGQDANGTGPGAGKRPYTDFSTASCTGGNCDRRAQYLVVATDLLVEDLKSFTEQWVPNGPVSKDFAKKSSEEILSAILTGMGSLSYGELAGERMQLGLMLHDPEEEHDCFSDNTHNSHYYDALGVQNVFKGEYTRIDGSKVSGPALDDLLPSEIKTELATAIADTLDKMQIIVKRAETVEAYDQMIGEGNAKGNAVVQDAIDALLVQTQAIQRATAVLNVGTIEFEGSESLDNPSVVQ